MSVYVGIDVHRKRSQVAVIGQGGEVLASRNVPNGVEPILYFLDHSFLSLSPGPAWPQRAVHQCDRVHGGLGRILGRRLSAAGPP
jgi:hypothetical protein